ncbi:nucleotidyltransferase [Listeria aquatica]|uniref:nucleotidyltransferase n=1 Tax=Listeria aquatica TaxID=1494960 RepID=UPI003F70158F
MRATGIIVEYNPLHNGHLYHLQEARKQTKADIIIAIMSGSFVQRGEPAIVSKELRTKWALEAGCDLVFELPVRFAVQQADIFASAAIELLKDLKTNALFFGSENGDATKFRIIAKLAASPLFEEALRRMLAEKKLSYGEAYTETLTSFTNELDVTKPNNILGLHYALANEKQEAGLKLYSLKRTNNYHATDVHSNDFASATALRKLLLENNLPAIKTKVPGFVYTSLENYQTPLLSFSSAYPYLRYRLLSDRNESLTVINSVTEGIENRLRRAAFEETAEEFLRATTTKRYSTSRVRRTAMQILLQFQKKDQPENHLRLLGMTKQGQAYLSTIKKELSLPLVSTPSKASQELIQYDIQASRLYHLLEGNSVQLNAPFSARPLLYF